MTKHMLKKIRWCLRARFRFVPEGPVDFGQVMEYILQVLVPPEGADDVHEVIHIISDTSSSTSSLWRFIDEYYGTNSDADSVLPPPSVPSSIIKGKSSTVDKSPG
ncbi:hypothetical protein Salat_2114900 [Sesamum alatum]|uniref:Uncharacterized protein n=1 Tax=Sesamum alatum TaxID=300844 RepID=A0AAE1Y0T2_9LAMI|nr:hypothetical protein Salat_2114900 [Sesamum alatum]